MPAVFYVTTSCNGFLDLDNPSAITTEYYDTRDGQIRLLTDMYSRLRTHYNTGELQYYGTDMYMAVSESQNERMFNGYDRTFNSTAGVVGGYWKNLYKMVQEANILLNRISPEVTGSDYESFLAQGTILRAFAYFYLVETFGDVPLYTEESDELITETTRTEEEVIYQFIIDELNGVLDILPAKASVTGRLSNTALMQLLGKVYLTRAYKYYGNRSDFTAAAALFDRIIEEKNYYLLDSFADVFAEDNQANAEVIFAIQYGTDKMYLGGGNPQHTLFAINITALHPDMFVYNQQDYSAAQRGYWIIPDIHQWFTDPVTDTRYDATFQREFYINDPTNERYGELGLYYPRWNDDSGDDRGAELFYPYRDGSDYGWYPQSTAMPVLSSGSDHMPIVKKFKETKIEWNSAGQREDMVMRVGETYLLSAEAHLGAGNTGMALSRVNDIRRRAAVDDAGAIAMELTSVDLDTILDERGREMVGEHDRWFDLKRTDKLIDRVYKYNIWVGFYDNLSSDHLVRPIPQDEINKVDGLEQNPGY